MIQQRREFAGIEAAAGRQHLMRRLRDVRKSEQADGVRLRRQMEKTVPRGQPIDVGEIADRHRQEIAMAEHRALGTSSRAAGVEYPGGIGRMQFRDGAGLAGERSAPIRIVQHEQPRSGRQGSGERAREIGGRDAQTRFAIARDERDLARVKLGVDGDRDEASAPDREQHGEIFRVVRHRQCDPIARPQAPEFVHRGGQMRGEASIGCEIVDRSIADRNGGVVGKALRGVEEQMGEVHRDELRRFKSATPMRAPTALSPPPPLRRRAIRPRFRPSRFSRWGPV